MANMFDPEKVVAVYLGKADKCMCGCSGDYAYTSKHRKFAGKDRGYEILDNEVNDLKVSLRLFRYYNSQVKEDVIDNCIFTKVVGDRQITVYLKNRGGGK